MHYYKMRMSRIISAKLKQILHFIVYLAEISVFKRECLLCSAPVISHSERYLCVECREKIENRPAGMCSVCGLELGIDSSVCGGCISDPPPFDRHIAFSVYRDEIRKLILLYKLSHVEPLKHYISQLYLNIIDKGIGDNYDLVIPVPSNPGGNRPFDPVREIAKKISACHGKKLSCSNLVKNRQTLKQSSLNYRMRMGNLNNAFSVNDPGELDGMRVLLIDDVYTTGTTIKKCAVLLGKYADAVYAVTLARSSNISLR